MKNDSNEREIALSSIELESALEEQINFYKSSVSINDYERGCNNGAIAALEHVKQTLGRYELKQVDYVSTKNLRLKQEEDMFVKCLPCNEILNKLIESCKKENQWSISQYRMAFVPIIFTKDNSENTK